MWEDSHKIFKNWKYAENKVRISSAHIYSYECYVNIISILNFEFISWFMLFSHIFYLRVHICEDHATSVANSY